MINGQAMDVRIRQRMLNLTEPPQLAAFAAHLLEELTQAALAHNHIIARRINARSVGRRDTCCAEAPNKPLPEVAEKAGEMVLQAPNSTLARYLLFADFSLESVQ